MHRTQGAGPAGALSKGKARDMHKDLRARKITDTDAKDRTIVVGALQRGGHVHAAVAEDRLRATLYGFVRETVTPGDPLHRCPFKWPCLRCRFHRGRTWVARRV